MRSFSSKAHAAELARKVRERFACAVLEAIPGLIDEMQKALHEAVGRNISGVSFVVLMDTRDIFRTHRGAFLNEVCERWHEASRGGVVRGPEHKKTEVLALLEEDVVEREIRASKLGAAVCDAAGSIWKDLRFRIETLERLEEISAHDPLRPEALVHCMLDAGTELEVSKLVWSLSHESLVAALVELYTEQYQRANTYLEKQGVTEELDLRNRLRRSRGAASGPSSSPRSLQGIDSGPSTGQWHGSGGGATGGGRGVGGQLRYRRADALVYPPDGEVDDRSAGTIVRPTMQRVRSHARAVWEQLHRLIDVRVRGDEQDGSSEPDVPNEPDEAATELMSTELARALSHEAAPTFAPTIAMTSAALAEVQGQALEMAAAVIDVAAGLRERAELLKGKAERPTERATIEIVSLMFQAILAEERIAPSIRIWFARLQVPVLRVAIVEPDFFAELDHPARVLIDRMGACAMGFTAARTPADRLETEVRRIVQVIEQYPETGRRVFERMLEEFKRFLGKAFAEGGVAARAASLAQMVEQREVLVVQYSIELGRMLAPLPVSDGIRAFLFEIWSDVLATMGVRLGAKHADMRRFKTAATDLIWSASAKRDRSDRAKVLQRLAGLLAVLREGMGTLGIDEEAQDGHIKQINDAIMQAFVSKEEGLSEGKLEEFSRALDQLEDVVTDDPDGDMMLDPGVIELMFGEDNAAMVEVISEGGSEPRPEMVEWAQDLELGSWFELLHNGHFMPVQYVWRSQRGQLHLFSVGEEKNLLIQTRRLAGYLQEGLLLTQEEEALTVIAAQAALTQLQDMPSELLD